MKNAAKITGFLFAGTAWSNGEIHGIATSAVNAAIGVNGIVKNVINAPMACHSPVIIAAIRLG